MTTLANVVRSAPRQAPLAYNEDIYAALMRDLKRHYVVPASRQRETLADKFERLAEKWRDETVFVSSTSQTISHPAYLAIIALGEPVVPLILRDLERKPGHWGPALAAITGVVPYAPSLRGNIRLIAKAWTDWGRARGYLA